MRIGYFDCFSGASGDMILGALVSAGVSVDALRSELGKLGMGGYELEVREVRRHGFLATKVDVKAVVVSGHRHLRQITEMIDGSGLSERVKQRAKLVFCRLAGAEAKVHGTTVEQVHFHEVGAVDAIVDVVGAMIGVEQLGLERLVCSPIPVGSGTVVCEHGVLPVPAPATLELLRDVPVAGCDEEGELTTPTGAAVLSTLADEFGPLPAMQVERWGFGAGSREGRRRPNLLRLIIGRVAEKEDEADGGTGYEADEVVVLEANLDDATGEQIGHAVTALLAAGALDVFTVPIIMKKNRPGVLLSVLASPDKQRTCEDALFAHTTTFGVRRHVCSRRKLRRTLEVVGTRYGPVHMKVGRGAGSVISASPEYEDCAEAARKHGVGLSEVMNEARAAWQAARGREDRDGPDAVR
jgi:hypothetical protein